MKKRCAEDFVFGQVNAPSTENKDLAVAMGILSKRIKGLPIGSPLTTILESSLMALGELLWDEYCQNRERNKSFSEEAFCREQPKEHKVSCSITADKIPMSTG